MAASATEHAASAVDHTNDAVGALREAIDKLHDVMGYLNSTTDRNTDLAANHLFEIADIVGSSTAREIGVELVDVSREIDNTGTEGIQQAINHLESQISRLHHARDRTETLAGVLGD